ncbi:MAG: hypothetical protein EA424_01300 [Planctomycetaceae bacterium]|nr:MAG: hypothetical protein EA424_01300 [Planctomycetaceae bacterium]
MGQLVASEPPQTRHQISRVTIPMKTSSVVHTVRTRCRADSNNRAAGSDVVPCRDNPQPGHLPDHSIGVEDTAFREASARLTADYQSHGVPVSLSPRIR